MSPFKTCRNRPADSLEQLYAEVRENTIWTSFSQRGTMRLKAPGALASKSHLHNKSCYTVLVALQSAQWNEGAMTMCCVNVQFGME